MNTNPSKTTVTKSGVRTPIRLPMAIKPYDFQRAWKAAQTGLPDKYYAILEHMLRFDDQIGSAMQQLTSGVLSGGINVMPREDAGEAGVIQAAIFQEIFDDLDIEAMIEHLITAHYFGFTAVTFPAESWEVNNYQGRSILAPITYEILPQSWIFARKVNKQDECTSLFIGDSALHELPIGAVLVNSERKIISYQDIDFTAYGKGAAVARLAVFKYYDVEDWAGFNEVFAQPLILGKTGPGGDSKVVKEAVMNMASDSRAVIGQNDTIEFPEANKTSSAETYEAFWNKLDNAISKVIKSESLTDNIAGSSHGSNGAAKTTNGIRLDVALMLSKKVSRNIRRKLMQPIADLNFKGQLLCDFVLKPKSDSDILNTVRAMNEAGKKVPLSKKQYYKKAELIEPSEPEDTIAVQANLGGLF